MILIGRNYTNLQKEISLSPTGLTLLAEMDDCEKKVDLLLKNLSLHEVKNLNKLLDKIRG